jgi:hypothetical protein
LIKINLDATFVKISSTVTLVAIAGDETGAGVLRGASVFDMEGVHAPVIAEAMTYGEGLVVARVKKFGLLFQNWADSGHSKLKIRRFLDFKFQFFKK